MKILAGENTYNFNFSLPAQSFEATPEQYRQAVIYLRQERKNGVRSIVNRETLSKRAKRVTEGIKYHFPLWHMKWILSDLNPLKWNFSHSQKARELQSEGIKVFDADKLEGIQYGIDVFKDLSMREILFLAYKSTNLMVIRGCENLCAHCFRSAVPARKDELSSMPFEDFKKIMDGFSEINKRINKILRNKKNKFTFVGDKQNAIVLGYNADVAAFFLDSDGMNVMAKDSNGKEYDFVDLTELIYNKMGKRSLFDTSGWDPKDEVLQARAEKYANYFNEQEDLEKVEQINLSINTYHPLYRDSYKLGYRAGTENDMTNPNIRRGKDLYDSYVERAANMLATLGFIKHVNLLLTFSISAEKHMDGMYFSDLKQIMSDVEKRCYEILKKRCSADEYAEKSKKIKDLIYYALSGDEYKHEHSNKVRCTYEGRYRTLYNSNNPNHMKTYHSTTKKIPDINTLSPDEYKSIFKYYNCIIDANGQIYYFEKSSSIRSMEKQLEISTNGKKTPKIANLDTD